MTEASPLRADPAGGPAWQRQVGAAAVCATTGVVAHVVGAALPPYLALVLLGTGLVGAGFLMAWAADAGESVFSGGLVLAAVALLTVLPEFVIEIRFAYIQATDLVTANLTGATRLLLTGAAAVPLLVAWVARARAERTETLTLGENRRLELATLAVTALFAVQIVIRGQLSAVDGVILVAFYVLYARRVQGTLGERAAVAGVPAGLVALPVDRRRPAIAGMIAFAGVVVLIVANPFADAILAAGTALGMDPYLLIQSAVPVATEAPEFVVVGVLVANHRPAQGLALFLASSVSQWTLGMGLLPLAYLAGGGGPAMALAPREQLEITFTIACTLFIVASLSTLRPTRVDAALIGAVFLVQLAYPSPAVRLAATVVIGVFAADLLWENRREVGASLRSVRRRGPGPAPTA
ncbi:sodium/hydrogen exchanger [Nocardioides aestuarii]|uniref:Sodium/calcium exchanger membrane region domain-containing protein n=1 Tax=Nocardioides aestuarii TaxID=252231 RepID=A0ABW4THM0_9ACTN